MGEYKKSVLNNSFAIVLSFSFVTALCLPLCEMFLHLDHTQAPDEKRMLNSMPAISTQPVSLREFPVGFDKYFSDHFGFRNRLLRWHSLVKATWFQTSPTELASIGKDGWLFLSDFHARRSSRAYPVLSRAELEEWRTGLEQRRDWLAERGIKFLFVIAPNKHTIYSEFLPPSLRQVPEVSHTDQFVEYMKQHSSIDILDLRPVMFQAKKEFRCYHKTDSHWNQQGAFRAYESIARKLEELFPDAPHLSEQDVDFAHAMSDGKDLAVMMGLEDTFREESLDAGVRAPNAAYTLVGTVKPKVKKHASRQTFAMEQDAASLPRCVMFRDSFAEDLYKFMSEDFSRLTCVFQSAFDQAVIEAEKPDIVIHEAVERALTMGLAAFTPEDSVEPYEVLSMVPLPLCNGGFEEVESGKSLGWTSGGNGQIAVTVDSEVVREGAYSLHTRVTSDTADFLVNTADFPIRGGQRVAISGCIKVKNCPGGAAVALRLKGDKEAAWVSTRRVSGTRDWTCVRWEGVLPQWTTHAYALLRLYPSGAGSEAWFDAVQVDVLSGE